MRGQRSLADPARLEFPSMRYHLSCPEPSTHLFHLALEVDRFRAVASLAVVESELPLAPPGLQTLSLSGPRVVRMKTSPFLMTRSYMESPGWFAVRPTVARGRVATLPQGVRGSAPCG